MAGYRADQDSAHPISQKGGRQVAGQSRPASPRGSQAVRLPSRFTRGYRLAVLPDVAGLPDVDGLLSAPGHR